MQFKAFENPPQSSGRIEKQLPDKNPKNEQEYLFSLLQHQLVEAVTGVFEKAGYYIVEIDGLVYKLYSLAYRQTD